MSNGVNTITVVLKGLMVLFAKDPTKCVIGLLKDAPSNHITRIQILKREPEATQFTPLDGGTFENQQAHGRFDLWLNAQTPGVTKKDAIGAIDRDKDDRPDSFNWVIDFERDFPDYLPTPPIGARADKLVSLITVLNGEISTKTRSRNRLQFRPAGSLRWLHVGKVAVEVAIKIDLVHPESKAIFAKHGGPSLNLVYGKDYQVHIQRCETDPGQATGHDIEFYMNVFSRPPATPLSFRSNPQSAGPPSTPDATCPVGGMGEGDPPPS